MILDVEVTPAPPLAHDDAMERGRRLVWQATGLLVLSELLANLLVVVIGGPDRTANATFRVFTDIVSAYFLIRGFAWARWLTVGLVATGMFVWVPLIAALFQRGVSLIGLFLLLVGTGMLTGAYVLARNPAADAFFRDAAARRAARGVAETAHDSILLAFGLLMSNVAWTVVVALSEAEPGRLPGILLVALVLLLLGVLVLRRHRWARWLALALVAACALFASGILVVAVQRGLDRVTGPVGFAVVSTTAAFLLLRSRAVAAHMRTGPSPSTGAYDAS